jgi:hypothetical protein
MSRRIKLVCTLVAETGRRPISSKKASRLLAVEANMSLPAEQVVAYRRWLALKKVYDPHSTTCLVDNVTALHDLAADVVGREQIVSYLEFGVATGKSILAFAQRFTHTDSRFVGFDSFEGLPADWERLKRGHFSMQGRLPQTADPRVGFVPGWFQNSLPIYLASERDAFADRLLVHFDADLYGSTLFILVHLWNTIRSYYFIMDDFMVDDCVALHDFMRAFPVRIGFHGFVPSRNGRPAKVFGRLTRASFRPGNAEHDEVAGQQDFVDLL